MSYKKLHNSPEYRACVTPSHAVWNQTFTEIELDYLEEYFGKMNLMDGYHGRKINEEYTTSDVERRISKINFINPNEENLWIFEKINSSIELINENFFNYDLNGYSAIQYSEYHSSVGGKYDYHMDMILGPQFNEIQTRKLSITMILNEPNKDFEGGEFVINYSSEQECENESVPLKRGQIIAFPSYMLHKVKPVTSGIRKSLVIWVLGPKFK